MRQTSFLICGRLTSSFTLFHCLCIRFDGSKNHFIHFFRLALQQWIETSFLTFLGSLEPFLVITSQRIMVAVLQKCVDELLTKVFVPFVDSTKLFVNTADCQV